MIGMVTHTGARGGAELSILDLLRDRSVPCKMILFSEGPIADDFARVGVPVAVLRAARPLLSITRKNMWPVLAAIPALPRLVWQLVKATRGCSAICASSQKALLPCALAAAVSRKPLIWWLHDYLTPEEFSSVGVRAQIAVANRFAAAVIADSDATGQSFVDSGGRKDVVQTVYYGIDSTPFDAVQHETVAEIKTRHGLDGKFVVGCFSRLAPWKGQGVLLDCLAGLPSNVHLLLVGSALFQEAEYEERLRQRVAELRLEARVTFAGFQMDIPGYMKACDLIVHASTAPEAFGRVVVEGMLAKRPVIAVDCAGPREIIDSGRTGLLFPMGDIPALRTAIRKVFENPSVAENFAQSGYESAVERFAPAYYRRTWSNVVQRAIGLDSGSQGSV